MKQIEMMDLMNRVVQYESEANSLKWIVQLFADLVATGLAWQLQGRYGREAKAMIDEGIITAQGDVNWDYFEEYYEL